MSIRLLVSISLILVGMTFSISSYSMHRVAPVVRSIGPKVLGAAGVGGAVYLSGYKRGNVAGYFKGYQRGRSHQYADLDDINQIPDLSQFPQEVLNNVSGSNPFKEPVSRIDVRSLKKVQLSDFHVMAEQLHSVLLQNDPSPLDWDYAVRIAGKLEKGAGEQYSEFVAIDFAEANAAFYSSYLEDLPAEVQKAQVERIKILTPNLIRAILPNHASEAEDAIRAWEKIQVSS